MSSTASACDLGLPQDRTSPYQPNGLEGRPHSHLLL
jgi:hypothetical protein